MTSTLTTIILAVYGLARMIFGVAQLVGLSAGYLINEFILRYPPQAKINVIDQDILALTYLAIVFRGAFHIISGIGVAKIRNWGRIWLLWGWPIMLLITYGLCFSKYAAWVKEGIVTDIFAVVSWPKIIIYFALISFDFYFVNIAIKANKGETSTAINNKKVSAVFFAAILFFALIIFLGKPIKQGFHKGYYKVSGAPASADSKAIAYKQITRFEKAKETEKISKPQGPSGIIIADNESVPVDVRNSQKETTSVVLPDEKGAPTKDKEGILYNVVIGVIGALLIIIGLFFQIGEIEQIKSAKGISLSGYALLALGFLLVLIYAIMSKLFVVGFAVFIICLLVIYIIFLKLKYDEQT